MKKIISLVLLTVVILSTFAFSGCDKADWEYGVTSQEDDKTQSLVDVGDTKIMSSDRVMSSYFDISLFDEENYSDIYLGKRFKISAFINGEEIKVPTKISTMNENGWTFCGGNAYDANSLVFAYETIDTLVQKNGLTLHAVFYNSSKSSQKLRDCYIVKLIVDNDFYTTPENFHSFNINGLTNSMAITDVIDTLGTPSHFYAVSDTSYYLDYFITKKDRRNGITVYINPVDDCITSIEFSYYK